ncbi:Oidioi.mRNA.OKI2018_I69.chr1.g16.t1.cds [Oikopleura dioica]|uniref:Oidioi.mRNA.OKI2018_I69.chr1.g16.t1.cds n=1 Tax=Oikopleura dioica TaxID=34765 RepID=A0ABN7SMC3_OIKDI|nr:Oidioi.mRNA.OKI2018_I69.chr1.g16.t1.cds [Oikopleura dioica]
MSTIDYQLKPLPETEIVLFCLGCDRKNTDNYQVDYLEPDDDIEDKAFSVWLVCEFCAKEITIAFTPEEWNLFASQADKQEDQYFSRVSAVAFCKTYLLSDCYGDLFIKAQQRKMARREIDKDEEKVCIFCHEDDVKMISSPCKHFYCEKCYAKHREISPRKDDCAFCRIPFRYTRFSDIVAEKRRND